MLSARGAADGSGAVLHYCAVVQPRRVASSGVGDDDGVGAFDAVAVDDVDARATAAQAVVPGAAVTAVVNKDERVRNTRLHSAGERDARSGCVVAGPMLLRLDVFLRRVVSLLALLTRLSGSLGVACVVCCVRPLAGPGDGQRRLQAACRKGLPLC